MKLFRRKQIEKYQDLCSFLEKNQETLTMIENFERSFPLNLLREDIVKTNGLLPAILHFYLEDKKEYARKLKDREDQKDILTRIDADDLIINELENIMPLYYKLQYAKKNKALLEKKLGIENHTLEESNESLSL